MHENSRAALWDERHATHHHIESHGPEPALVELAGPLAPGRAIDLAAGDGRNAVWLAAHGWATTAVDFSGVALERARESAARAGVAVEWVHADLLAWRPPAQGFDLVLLAYLHLPPVERRLVYRAAADAVAPGGRLLVAGHDRTNLGRGTGGPQDPEVLFTAEEIAADLDGLVVERAEAVTSDAGEGRQAVTAVVVARRPRTDDAESGVGPHAR